MSHLSVLRRLRHQLLSNSGFELVLDAYQPTHEPLLSKLHHLQLSSIVRFLLQVALSKLKDSYRNAHVTDQSNPSSLRFWWERISSRNLHGTVWLNPLNENFGIRDPERFGGRSFSRLPSIVRSRFKPDARIPLALHRTSSLRSTAYRVN